MELNAIMREHVDVEASPEDALALVAEVPRSAAHFPGVERLEKHGDGYRWTLVKQGAGPVSVQVVWGCSYQVDEAGLRMRWAPLPGVGNTVVHGQWTIEKRGSGCRIYLYNNFVVNVPVPRMFKKMAESLLAKENGRQTTLYLQNLKTTLEGGNGRVSLQ